MTEITFRHAEMGLPRFPPNVEKITVQHDSLRKWLVVSRNDTELKFPLSEADCQHLADLLLSSDPGHAGKIEEETQTSDQAASEGCAETRTPKGTSEDAS